MVRLYLNSDGFLMLCAQNLCVEPIVISLNPILTEFDKRHIGYVYSKTHLLYTFGYKYPLRNGLELF